MRRASLSLFKGKGLGIGFNRERDSSGTTVATDRRTIGAEAGAKVMERIARREPPKRT
jgi:DNA-binding LacI/PurR family transcriptional regulator